MKRKINNQTIKNLLVEKQVTQKALADFAKIDEPNLSKALNDDRNISMDYVIDIAKFFEVNPISITVAYTNENNTKEATNHTSTKG